MCLSFQLSRSEPKTCGITEQILARTVGSEIDAVDFVVEETCGEASLGKASPSATHQNFLLAAQIVMTRWKTFSELSDGRSQKLAWRWWDSKNHLVLLQGLDARVNKTRLLFNCLSRSDVLTVVGGR
jgi:hypothetical protein